MSNVIFKFSLDEKIAGQLEQLAKKIKVPLGQLLNLFISRGLLAFESAAKGRAAKGKPASSKAANPKAEIAPPESSGNLVTIDLRHLSPRTSSFLRQFAARQGISLAEQIERSLDEGYGQS